MKVISHACELRPGSRPVCVAIGVFDGLHRGHQRVIRRTLRRACDLGGLAVVLTFDRHPNSVLAPAHAPPLIYPLWKKLELLAEWGADATLLVEFTRAFSHQPAEAFVRSLARDWRHLRQISVGTSFTFGRGRQGNLALLKVLGRQLGFRVAGSAPVEYHGRVISSSLVRSAVKAGHLELAGRMLGRPYTLAGQVVSGDHLGRQMGFPTANLLAANQVLPPNGVYAVRALIQGQSHPAVLNLGFRPTLATPGPQLRIEAHLLDFQGDLYDTKLEIRFLRKLRLERHFASAEALREQIQLDVERARKILAAHSTTRQAGLPRPR